VKIPRLLLMPAVIAAMCTIQCPGAKLMEEPPRGGADSLVFVYLHGFGGVKESPEFCKNLREFLVEEKVPSEVINYQWDSVKVDPLKVGASWIKSQKMANAEAPRFRREVLEKLERDERSYVIVAFSVGTRVALQSLESTESELKGLRGVYFLGSAMTKDTTLKNRKSLPKGMKITNYHSPIRDMVHRMAFNFMSETPPGGQVGFDDGKVFENYPVSCAHAHKRVGIATDYSGLAEAIAFLELYEQGVTISGCTKMNWKTPVVKGEMWWNKIHTLSLRSGTVELEQHLMRPGYYRAVSVEKNGKRKRIARGDNLHAILQELGIEDGS
jgi:hypothetical protein